MAFDPTKDYITRMEKYLTKMAGNNDVDVPEPITRFEHYLKAIIDNISSGGGGGGGGGGVFIVNVDMQTMTLTLDKTWKEILDASSESAVVLISAYDDGRVEQSLLKVIGSGGGQYGVMFGDASYLTDSENGYPVFDEN